MLTSRKTNGQVFRPARSDYSTALSPSATQVHGLYHIGSDAADGETSMNAISIYN
jgi:hypothetical protein